MPHFDGIVIGHKRDTHISTSITGWGRCLCVDSFGTLSEGIILIYTYNYIYIIIYYPHLSANLMVPNNFPIFNIAIFWAIIIIIARAIFLD